MKTKDNWIQFVESRCDKYFAAVFDPTYARRHNKTEWDLRAERLAYAYYHRIFNQAGYGTDYTGLPQFEGFFK